MVIVEMFNKTFRMGGGGGGGDILAYWWSLRLLT